MKAAQRGDLDAYGRIFIRFQDMAFAVALARLREPAVAQDVAQEAAAGADASRQDREGHTALDLARRQGDPAIIAALSRAVAR